MQVAEVKQRIDRVEQCADDAERAMQKGKVPGELRQSVDSLHAQARQLQQACSNQQQQGDAGSLRQMVMQLEQASDRAKQACQQAGSVDPQLKQSVQRAHDEASSLKKEIQMG
jgi:hypothetical protein